MITFAELVQLFTSLAGVGALIAVGVNIAKTLGLKDGAAPVVITVSNVVGVILLLVLKIFKPGVNIEGLDQVAGTIAAILQLVMGLVVQIGSSKVTHLALKGTPLIGKSYSLDRERALDALANKPIGGG